MKKNTDVLLQICGDTARVVEDMSLTAAFNSSSASVDGRAAPASTDTDGNAETLTQKLESLLDNLQEIESFLSSSEGMSARKEEINQRDNDLTLRMQVIMC